MQTVYLILASLAALAILIGAPILTIRALVLMARLEGTRRDLAELVAEATLSLQHVNRLVARTQEGVDRLHHALERIERVLTLLQPATAVGGLLAGARRVLTGRHEQSVAPSENSNVVPISRDDVNK